MSPSAGRFCQLWAIADLTVELNTNNNLIFEAGQLLLKPFSNIRAVESPSISLSIFSAGKEQDIPFRIPSTAKWVRPHLWLYGNDCFIFDFEPALIFVDLASCTARGFIVRPEGLCKDWLTEVAILVPLVALLRSRGAYRIHAGAVAMDGLGILLPGARKSGKTTTLINLVRSGFQFISDDRPLIRENANGLEILAFHQHVYVTEATIRFFPELRFLLGQDNEHPKKSFLIDKVYPNSTIDKCEPRLLIFPQIMSSNRSTLTPISRPECLQRLIPHSLKVFGSHQIARAHFQTLSHLVESTTPYLLHLGRDLDAVPDMIRRCLHQD